MVATRDKRVDPHLYPKLRRESLSTSSKERNERRAYRRRVETTKSLSSSSGPTMTRELGTWRSLGFPLLLPVSVPVFTLVLILISQQTDARRSSPLVPEDVGRRPTRTAECNFGKQPKEIGSTWFADLGPPFGVMYCIKCECIAIQKKRRIVAHVQCRNIKNECPVPSCSEPVLEPGRCCKACPGDGPSPDIVQDVPANVTEEEERNMKHFAALLTGRTSQFLQREELPLAGAGGTGTAGPHAVAAGRFTFHRRNLYYSFYTSSGRPRPTAVQFVNYAGDILQEQLLPSPSEYQNRTAKVCGVWRRLPRDYRRLLRERKLYVSLLWGSGRSLSGQIGWYHALSSELFSALLEPAHGGSPGTGGTAAVSVYAPGPAHAPSAAVHISLLFNGVFAPSEVANVPLIVRLEAPATGHVVLEEVVVVNKPSHELNAVEVRSPVSASDLGLLTHGELILTLSSKRSSEVVRLKGRVVTRTTCEIFQATVSLADSDPCQENTSLATSGTQLSGLAWMYMSHDGSLVYNIQIDNMDPDAVLVLTLVAGRGRRRIEFEDFTPSLQDGKANGSVALLNARELEQLYAGELALNAATQTDGSLIRGRLTPRLLADARDAFAPTLLKRPNVSLPATLVGMAWLSIDMECTLHYEIVLSGLKERDERRFTLYLELLPILAPGAPKATRVLEHFQGSQLEGFVMGLPQHELSKLEYGVVFLDIKDSNTGQTVLKGRVKQVNVPPVCLPQITDNSVTVEFAQGPGEDPPEVTSCYHEKQFYNDGMQWSSVTDPCTMCSCHHGQVRCDAVVCPPVTCDAKPQPGDCCPTCSNTTTSQESNTSSTRGCVLANQFHKAGSSWHPYLPPNGFDTCAVCTCNPATLEVSCPRVQCPPLECSERIAFRPDKKACCKQCPPKLPEKQEPTDSQQQQDEQVSSGTVTQRTAEQILADGGCKNPRGPPYENGKEWHPQLFSYGEYKCVKCRCKDGNQTCERKRCSRSVCLSAKKGAVDECCPQCKRYRHTKHHKTPINS